MGPRISAGQNCPGGGHVRGTDAARTTQARARAKTAPRSTLIGGFHQRRLWTGFAGATSWACTAAIRSWVASASLTRWTLLGM